MLLSFVLAESALELVPREVWKTPAVMSDARRRELEPSKILLDRSFHHSAMARLKDSEKRGRPDLVHEAMLSVTGTPLYLEGRVKMFVHTCDGVVLEVQEKTRIPKSYFRFRGLVEQALVERPKTGLVKMEESGLRGLMKRISPDLVVGFSVVGKNVGLEGVAKEVAGARNPAVLVGGFPHGHFSPETVALVSTLCRIDPRPLEAHVVAARVVYEVEKASKGIND